MAGRLTIGAALCVLLMLLAGCVEKAGGEAVAEDPSVALAGCDDAVEACALPASGVEKVEVIHFHGTNQCYSCITVGDYAEDTVKAHFAAELASGKVVFRHVNGDLGENAEITKKYGATGSSLWIGVYDDEGFTAEQNINVWYKINDKNAYMDYLKGVIGGKLGGT